MISVIKALLSGVVESAGVPAERIARSAAEEQKLVTQRAAYPMAALISSPGRYADPKRREAVIVQDGRRIYRQMRIMRVLPVLVKVVGKDEIQAAAVLDKIIASLPRSFEFEGIEGEIDPTAEEYSDYDSRMHQRYEAGMVVEFSVDVGPQGIAGVPVLGVEQRDPQFEGVSK